MEAKVSATRSYLCVNIRRRISAVRYFMSNFVYPIRPWNLLPNTEMVNHCPKALYHKANVKLTKTRIQPGTSLPKGSFLENEHRRQ